MVKNAILNLIRRTGLEVRRYHPNNSQHCATQRMLRHLGITLVLDVGANTGQYGEELLAAGYAGRLVSFEPLSSAHAALTKRASTHARWAVHPRAAIGAEPGQAMINVAGNSVSSSLLVTLGSHVDAAPESQTIGIESVPLIRLDDVLPQYLTVTDRLLLKVDTQGYEWEVLDGAGDSLDSAAAVQLELSLLPLYAGQRLWRDYVERLESSGFQLYFAYPAFTNPDTGQSLQWDAMFVRRALLG